MPDSKEDRTFEITVNTDLVIRRIDMGGPAEVAESDGAARSAVPFVVLFEESGNLLNATEGSVAFEQETGGDRATTRLVNRGDSIRVTTQWLAACSVSTPRGTLPEERPFIAMGSLNPEEPFYWIEFGGQCSGRIELTLM